MLSDLPNLLVAWGIQATGVLSPGPGVALILGIATSRGRGPALLTCVGISLGALLLAVLTVIGLATVLAEARGVMIAVRWLGAAYLLWLAWGAFRRAAAPPPPPEGRASGPGGRTGRTILGGFLFQMANPKAIFFWIAVAAVGSLQTVSAASLALFLAGAWAISFAGHGGWAILLSSSPFRALYVRARRGVEAALGAIFAAAALKIATERS